VETPLGETISGVHDVFLVFKAEAEEPFTLNWIRFNGPGYTAEYGSGACACTLNAGAPPRAAPLSFLVVSICASRRRRRG
jgi:hypothetical protein